MDETQEQITARIVAQAATATAKAVLEAAQAAAMVIAKENTTSSTQIAVLQTEMVTLKTQQTSFEADMNRKMDKLDMTFKEMFAKLDEILLGRPTWAVSMIITVLSSICVGLAVFLFTHL